VALFKSLRGKREKLPTKKTDGYAYFCTDDKTFHIDYMDENGVVQRGQLNAKDSETLSGASLEEILELSTEDLADVAKSGLIDDISIGNGTTLIFDCGNSNV